jgi:hypothetical protein
MNSTVEACSQKIFRVDLKMPSILAADRQNPPAGVVFHDQIADRFAKRLKMIGAPELDAPSARGLPGPPVDHERRADQTRRNTRGDKPRVGANQPDPFGDCQC